MNSNPSESWPAAELQFRLACEECHQRKIRCDLPPDSNTTICNACRTNKRRCLFSIKSKTGRPRKPATANGGLASAARPRQRHGLNGPAAEHVHVISMHEGAGPPRMYRPSTAPPPSPPFVDTPETLAGSGNVQQEPWLLSPSPPVTGGTFGVAALHEFGQQDQKRLFDGIFMDDYAFPAPGQNGSPAVPADMETAEMREPEIHARLPHTAPSPPVSSSTGPDWPRQDATDDFTETLSLCAEVHRACHGRPLNFLCSADQEELASVLRVINDLGSKTHALAATHQVSRKPSPGRRDRYNRNIIHVSVAQAVEMAADLIRFNLGLLTGQRSDGGGGCGGAFEQQHDNHKNGDELDSSAGDRRPDLGGRRGGDAAARDMRLESVLALVRLDYSLNQFTLLVGSHGYDEHDAAADGASDELSHAAPHRAGGCCGREAEGRESAGGGGEWDASSVVCPCCAGVSAARIKHVRSLGQTLVARLRSVW